MRITTAVLTLLILVSGAAAQQAEADSSAPFGLKWGMSQDEVVALGAHFSQEEETHFGKQATASNLPKALADTEEVVLFFGFDDRLWRIFSASVSWENDAYGSQAVARFNELTGFLSERYGARHIRYPFTD